MEKISLCDRGSVVVEAALIFPIFFLLIFAATDMVRLIDLTGRVNQSSALIADTVSREVKIDEAELSDSLKLISQITSTESVENSLSLKISAISSQPTIGTNILWTRLFSNAAASCETATPTLDKYSTETQGRKNTGYYVVVDLCVQPTGAFFLSRLFLAKKMRLRSQSISVATHPAIRSLE
ncbi:pilus assembly protein [Sneathiella marina]|uniref:Pilus assembly protein n=1 Tax=Sneathiella marina TaxID=2950108 RepID=A0ABY4W8D5_9PROT|nr:TadE/TadG family type IV pilus assembly protein [Sneathiella marina]USG63044.1 pilus assembly protein [Sneathiella marina]